MDLEPAEIRVLGCLLEKQRTTPDAYPLSLNALRLACNQATNRDPVVEYDEAAVRDALHRLGRRRYTRLASGAGSRAPKYRHLLEETLPMGEDERAVMCVLMLRGPQTPGELKQRTDRMHRFADLQALEATLDRLIARGLAARLDRRPGQKEERYRELLGSDSPDPGFGGASGIFGARPDQPGTQPTGLAVDSESQRPALDELEARMAGLERAVEELGGERVARLEREVAALREALGG